MTHVNCDMYDCVNCDDGECTAEEISLNEGHVCDGGCDEGWRMKEDEDEGDE